VRCPGGRELGYADIRVHFRANEHGVAHDIPLPALGSPFPAAQKNRPDPAPTKLKKSTASWYLSTEDWTRPHRSVFEADWQPRRWCLLVGGATSSV
jgi:hypothetical protein